MYSKKKGKNIGTVFFRFYKINYTDSISKCRNPDSIELKHPKLALFLHYCRSKPLSCHS